MVKKYDNNGGLIMLDRMDQESLQLLVQKHADRLLDEFMALKIGVESFEDFKASPDIFQDPLPLNLKERQELNLSLTGYFKKFIKDQTIRTLKAILHNAYTKDIILLLNDRDRSVLDQLMKIDIDLPSTDTSSWSNKLNNFILREEEIKSALNILESVTTKTKSNPRILEKKFNREIFFDKTIRVMRCLINLQSYYRDEKSYFSRFSKTNVFTKHCIDYITRITKILELVSIIYNRNTFIGYAGLEDLKYILQDPYLMPHNIRDNKEIFSSCYHLLGTLLTPFQLEELLRKSDAHTLFDFLGEGLSLSYLRINTEETRQQMKVLLNTWKELIKQENPNRVKVLICDIISTLATGPFCEHLCYFILNNRILSSIFFSDANQPLPVLNSLIDSFDEGSVGVNSRARLLVNMLSRMLLEKTQEGGSTIKFEDQKHLQERLKIHIYKNKTESFLAEEEIDTHHIKTEEDLGKFFKDIIFDIEFYLTTKQDDSAVLTNVCLLLNVNHIDKIKPILTELRKIIEEDIGRFPLKNILEFLASKCPQETKIHNIWLQLLTLIFRKYKELILPELCKDIMDSNSIEIIETCKKISQALDIWKSLLSIAEDDSIAQYLTSGTKDGDPALEDSGLLYETILETNKIITIIPHASVILLKAPDIWKRFLSIREKGSIAQHQTSGTKDGDPALEDSGLLYETILETNKIITIIANILTRFENDILKQLCQSIKSSEGTKEHDLETISRIIAIRTELCDTKNLIQEDNTLFNQALESSEKIISHTLYTFFAKQIKVLLELDTIKSPDSAQDQTSKDALNETLNQFEKLRVILEGTKCPLYADSIRMLNELPSDSSSLLLEKLLKYLGSQLQARGITLQIKNNIIDTLLVKIQERMQDETIEEDGSYANFEQTMNKFKRAEKEASLLIESAPVFLDKETTQNKIITNFYSKMEEIKQKYSSELFTKHIQPWLSAFMEILELFNWQLSFIKNCPKEFSANRTSFEESVTNFKKYIQPLTNFIEFFRRFKDQFSNEVSSKIISSIEELQTQTQSIQNNGNRAFQALKGAHESRSYVNVISGLFQPTMEKDANSLETIINKFLPINTVLQAYKPCVLPTSTEGFGEGTTSPSLKKGFGEGRTSPLCKTCPPPPQEGFGKGPQMVTPSAPPQEGFDEPLSKPCPPPPQEGFRKGPQMVTPSAPPALADNNLRGLDSGIETDSNVSDAGSEPS